MVISPTCLFLLFVMLSVCLKIKCLCQKTLFPSLLTWLSMTFLPQISWRLQTLEHSWDSVQKFVSTPSKTTGSLQHTFAWFERDFLLCVIFACESDEGWSYWPDFCWLFDACNKSKLYVNSKWKPTLGDVPYWVSQRLSKFQVRVQRLFKERDATSNLLPHQQHLLNTLPSDPVFLFPEADKGLGPCAVTYDQYVTDVFAHLTNEQVYERLSEEEAMTVVKQLQSDLKSWL